MMHGQKNIKPLYMFRTDLLSIIKVLILYSQQLVYVILVMLTASEVRMELLQPDLARRQTT